MAGAFAERVETASQREHQILARGKHLLDADFGGIGIEGERTFRAEQGRFVEHDVAIRIAAMDGSQGFGTALGRHVGGGEEGFHATQHLRRTGDEADAHRAGGFCAHVVGLQVPQRVFDLTEEC